VRLSVKVTRRGAAVRGATVSFAGRRATTNRKGAASLTVKLATGGRFKVLANKGKFRGQSESITVR
jgi:hypothetical protein